MIEDDNMVKRCTDSMLNKGIVSVFMTPSGETYISINTKNINVLTEIDSSLAELSIRRAFYEYDQRFIKIRVEDVVTYLKLISYGNRVNYNLTYRIYMDESNSDYYYDLNQDTNEVLKIADGLITICHPNRFLFKKSGDYKRQVMPNLQIEKNILLKYVDKHFNIKTENEKKLFAIFLVSLFFSSVSCPILLLFGEKGSSKSTTLRKIQAIVSPTTSDLIGMPKTLDDLAIRLSNNYFVAIDNVNRISRDISDLLCRSVTSGSISKRKLYSNNEETILNIKAKIGINSVSQVANQSDMLDRCLILNMLRVSPDEMVTEKRIWEEFNNDLPNILGCIFNIVAEVLQDNTEIETTKLIRLGDFHELCIRIGKTIDISEDAVNEIIWENQKRVNEIAIEQDVIATTIISFMKYRSSYIDSMSNLLKLLKSEADCLAISQKLLPATPNHLSMRLKKVKSNLEEEYGIFFEVKNKGAYKEITIIKK